MGHKKFTIVHLRKDCIGCGSCFAVAPHTWEMNPSDGLADLKGGVEKNGNVVAECDMDTYDDNMKASDYCPVGVIRIAKKEIDDIC